MRRGVVVVQQSARGGWPLLVLWLLAVMMSLGIKLSLILQIADVARS